MNIKFVFLCHRRFEYPESNFAESDKLQFSFEFETEIFCDLREREDVADIFLSRLRIIFEFTQKVGSLLK